MFFRENRIKRFDYNALLEEKLSQSTLVVRAYENGKGFIESDRLYRDKYASALQECCFLEVVKEVNRIFYANYSGATRSHQSLTERLFTLLWIPIVLFAGLALTLPFASFPQEEVVLLGLLCVILMVLFYLSMRSYYQKPSQNNQM